MQKEEEDGKRFSVQPYLQLGCGQNLFAHVRSLLPREKSFNVDKMAQSNLAILKGDLLFMMSVSPLLFERISLVSSRILRVIEVLTILVCLVTCRIIHVRF